MDREKPPGLIETDGQQAITCASPSDYEAIMKKLLEAETDRHINRDMMKLKQDYTALAISHRELLAALKEIIEDDDKNVWPFYQIHRQAIRNADALGEE